MLIRILNSKVFIRIMVIANLFMLALLLFLRFSNYGPSESNNPTEELMKSYEPMKLTFVGEIHLEKGHLIKGKANDNHFDFSSAFTYVSDYFLDDDITFANLQSVFAGDIHVDDTEVNHRFKINAPDEFARDLKKAGFDFLFTANSRSCDFGEDGMTRTIQVLDEYALKHTGTFSDFASAREIVVNEIKGIKFSNLSYASTSNNNSPLSKTFRLNQIKPEAIRSGIQGARMNGAEIVIIHFDFNSVAKPDPAYIKEIINFAMEEGADIIIANQENFLSKVSCYRTRNPFTDQGVVAYSLGSFFSQKDSQNIGSAVLGIELQKDPVSQRISLRHMEILPTVLVKPEVSKSEDYFIYPTQLSLESNHPTVDTLLTEDELSELKQIYFSAQEKLEITSSGENNCTISLADIFL